MLVGSRCEIALDEWKGSFGESCQHPREIEGTKEARKRGDFGREVRNRAGFRHRREFSLNDCRHENGSESGAEIP